MAMSQPCPCCSADCIKKKVKTRLSWVLVMVLLGTCDVFINWVNLADLTSPELGRGLVLGPPPAYMWVLLLAFTVVGTVLYVPETLNTLSVFYGDSGTTLVPIIYEQLVTLPAEQIPLAAINYFISRCRQQYASTMQTLCGTTSIVFIFVRIVWYAHMEGKLLQRKDDVKMKKGAFMAICALYACSMAFPIMNWRSQPALQLTPDDQKLVAVFLLKAPGLERRRLKGEQVDALLKAQGRDLRAPHLVRSIADIVSAGPAGLEARYSCNTSTPFLPAECPTDGHLLFRFIYAEYTEAGPYGEIVYNYAFLPAAVPSDGGGPGSGGGGSGEGGWGPCVPSTGGLANHWKLFYLTYVVEEHQGKEHVMLSSPWKKTCTTPEPWYDPTVPVCAPGGGPSPLPARRGAESARLTADNRTNYRLVDPDPAS